MGVLAGLALAAGAVPALAGPWSRLPDAVSRLQVAPDDPEALAVLAEAERSVLAEAAGGRLASTAALAEVYAALVAPLVEGELRVEALHHRVAERLVAWGDEHADLQPERAVTAWALAARLEPAEDTAARLLPLLVPPAEAEPGDLWRSPVDGAELVYIPRFRFRMGCTVYDRECRPDEGARRWIVGTPLWLDRFEVTVERYRRCVEAGACTPAGDPEPDAPRPAGEAPITGVTWYQARAFATWAGRRLPSEVEWEQAARGDRTDRRFPWGNYPEPERGNFVDGHGPDVYTGPAPVGSFAATGWGFHDLAGNVREWCHDAYSADLSQAPIDGSPVAGGPLRVVRGGSFRLPIERARVSARDALPPDQQLIDLGFRCAVDPGWRPTAAVVAALAGAAFPIAAEPPADLVTANLDAADRRYLLRRAVTWLTLEGRFDEALPYAIELQRREPRDRVAVALLDRIEGDLLDAASRDEVGLPPRVQAYRAALDAGARLDRRRRRFDAMIAEALAENGERLRRSGSVEEAELRFRLALELDPDNREIARLAAALLPSPGAVRTWDGDGREMVWVPAGSLRMGAGPGDGDAAADEQPPRQVAVRGFWLDRTEVTNRAYRRCVEAGACTAPYRRQQYDDPGSGELPVLWVDWYQARAYARWAGKRLPSESEWEWAARGGSQTRYPWGDSWQDGRANVVGRRGSDRWSGPSPVSSFPATTWGLYDLLGNAAEWTEDVYWPDLGEVPGDGSALVQLRAGVAPAERVIRGGSYRDVPAGVRVSRRMHRTPTSWLRTVGFRCAADP